MSRFTFSPRRVLPILLALSTQWFALTGCLAQESAALPVSFVKPLEKAPSLQKETSPNIGVNLEGLSDWHRAFMFADAMKTSRRWGTTDKPWEHTVKTDDKGWPLEDAGVVVIADTPNIGGTYRLSFEGKARVVAKFGAEIQNLKRDDAKNITTADVVVPDSFHTLMLEFHDTNGGVKNVKMLRPNMNGKSTFTPYFLEKLKPFSTLRFMDFLSTNNSPVKHWSERTTPEYSTQAREQGGALEYVVELANESGKDIWVCVPDQADDDYVRQMAQLLKDGLTKNQKIYVEWSNEVWNWQFQQAQRNLQAARVEGKQNASPLAYDSNDNEGYWAFRRIAKRSAEVGQIFRDVFKADDWSRIRPVYATQIAYEEVFKQGLLYIEHHYKKPNAVFYGLAGAPYFQVSDELNKKKDLTLDEIFAAIPESRAQSLQWTKTMNSYAEKYGLHALAYEGGQHLQDHSDVGNAEIKVQANRDPRMGEAMEKYLRGWNENGGELFMYFTLTSPFTKWGSWGLLEDSRQKSSPKYDAVMRVLQSAKP